MINEGCITRGTSHNDPVVSIYPVSLLEDDTDWWTIDIWLFILDSNSRKDFMEPLGSMETNYLSLMDVRRTQMSFSEVD